jgi:hypothetical protein
MKANFSRARILVFGLLIAVAPAFAHHGVAAYDAGKQITLTGTVQDWFWANPHCILQFDSNDAHGQVVHWTMETGNPSDLVNNGWTKQSLKPGDHISVTIQPAKNGKPIGRIVEVVLPNGQKLHTWAQAPSDAK